MTDKELTDKLWTYIPMSDVQDLLTRTYKLEPDQYAVFYHFVDGQIVVEFESVYKANNVVTLIRKYLQQVITTRFNDTNS